ncbi:hypothetical protein FIV42_20835 [Persicimonas caeni]|uniref:Uncharacterized protein n=1 Tax=Persicimonas caeni TaxID=2292766 RepID=A0A4Y6PXQ5_PERCE|nr:hypothetical protein FIV42_20835 [Persicimonas caeni]QED34323.1 hypothetical protein FRD00_20830 [Persicimonas caeni]
MACFSAACFSLAPSASGRPRRPRQARPTRRSPAAPAAPRLASQARPAPSACHIRGRQEGSAKPEATRSGRNLYVRTDASQPHLMEPLTWCQTPCYHAKGRRHWRRRFQRWL